MSSVILEIDSSPKLASLALQPPPKKKRAAVNNTFRIPTSPVKRSRTILAWANNVHPGSPAPVTPASGVLPSRSTSVSSPLLQAFRYPSLTRTGSRRQSVGSGIPPPSFFFVSTPRTPDAKFDFTAFGYASIFVDVPVPTPITPDIYKSKPGARIPNFQDVATASLPIPSVTKSNGANMFKRLLGTKSKTNFQAHAK